MNADMTIWAVKKGDLVKIREYIDGCEDRYVYLRGIVLGEPDRLDSLQISMWPSVRVYMFDSGTIRECYPGSVEVISVS